LDDDLSLDGDFLLPYELNVLSPLKKFSSKVRSGGIKGGGEPGDILLA